MLRKVIFKKREYFQLVLSTIGASLGFFVLLAGLQFYIDLKSILVDKTQMATTDFLVLHKKVSDMDMLALSKNEFEEDEIKDIQEQSFVKAVGIITPGLFKVDATLNGAGELFKMNTAMFFEAIDDRFIDLANDKWKWAEGDTDVPIILPSVLLEAYNFGMAPSQGLPPITEKTLTRFNYDIEIIGKNASQNFTGRIIGFSDRINTILVPKTFIEWANTVFPNRDPGNPSQLVIEVDDISNPALAKFLEKNNYETNKDKLNGSRMRSILNICLIVFLLLGAIILLMAALTFIQYARISVYRVTQELKTVMLIGYHYTQPAKVFLRLFISLNLIALGCAIGGLLWFKNYMNFYFEEYYFTTAEGIDNYTVMMAILTVIFFLGANVFSVFRLLRSLAKSLQ